MSINYLTLLDNKYVNYVIIGLSIIFIGIFRTYSPEYQHTLSQIAKTPIILVSSLAFISLLSYYNTPIAILLSVILLMILSSNIDNSNNSNNSNKINNNNNSKTVEGFADKKQKNYLLDHFNIDPEKFSNSLRDGLAENRRLKAEKSLNKIKSSNSKHESHGVIKSGKKKDDLSIPKRQFNIDNQQDKNLLNTREICRDIINRINYEYEDKPYLLKYISSRLEEIVDINSLLEEDD